MAEPHVITALIRKRAEIAGQIEHTQTALRQLIIDLDNLDATLRLFVPDIELDEIKPRPFPPKHQAFRGEITRIVFESLRRAGKPLTAQEIAQHVMAERGLNTADKALVKAMGKRVGACLRHNRAKGLMRSERETGQLLVWQITS